MKYNQPLQDAPVPLWRRITAFINIVLLTFYTCLPGTAAAYQLISDGFIASEINSNPQFQLSTNSNYLVEKSYYITDTTSTSTQTIASFHQKLLDHRKSSLPTPLMIPIINGDITIIIPHYPLEKLIGDSFVQARFIRSQIFNQLNRNLLNDSTGTEAQQINALYNRAFDFSAVSNKRFGEQLTRADINTFGHDFIWPELRTVNNQKILVPVVHLTDDTIDEQLVDSHVVEFSGTETQFNNITIDSGTLLLRRGTSLNVASNLNINEGALLKSSHDLNVVVGGTLQILSGQITAQDNMKIIAGQYVQKTVVHRFATPTSQGTRLGKIADVNSVTGNVYIESSGDIQIHSGTVSGNNIELNAGNNIILTSQKTTYTSSGVVNGWDENESIISQLGSQLTASDNIALLAAGAIEINASTLHADKGHITLLAEFGVSIGDSLSISEKQAHKKWGNKTEDESSYVTVAMRSVLDSGKNITITTTKGDITLKAVDIKSVEGTSAIATSGAVNLLMSVENDHYNYSSVKESLFTIKTVDRGHRFETPVYNSIVGGFQTEALYGVNVEYEGDATLTLDQQVSALSEFEGLEWLAYIRTDNPDINWTSVDLEYEEWDKTSKSLSPAAMAVISIAVAIATSGASAGWAEVITGSTTGTLNASIAAGMSSIVSQATVAVANGAVNGDIGGALEDLASSEFIKSVAIAMVTAGAMAELDSEFFTNTPTEAEVLNAASAEGFTDIAINGPEFLQFQDKLRQLTLTQQASQALVNSTVSAGVQTIVYGEGFDEFGDAFITSLGQNTINIIGKNLANKIGDAAKDKDIVLATKYVAHAALGCVLGAAQSVNNNGNSDLTESDCISGAGGAVIGELVAEKLRQDFFDDANQLAKGKKLSAQQLEVMYNDYKTDGVNFARLSAALAAFSLGGNVDIAAGTAENAAENNAFWFLVIPAFIALEKAYTVYEYVTWADELGKAIKADDKAKIDGLLKDKFEDIAFDATIGLIPGGKVLDKVIEKLRNTFGKDADFDKVTNTIEHYKTSVDSGKPTTIELPNAPRMEPKIEHHIGGRTPIAQSIHTKTAQTDAIDGVKNGSIDLNANGNSIRKGNYGEMSIDNDLVNRGFIPLHDRVVDIDLSAPSGIDGIFEKNGMYYIVETKCCSGTKNSLSTTKLADNTYQMDEDWIIKRINKLSIPNDIKQKIRSNYTPVLARVTESGTLTYSKIIHNPGAKPSIPRGKAAIVTGINGGG